MLATLLPPVDRAARDRAGIRMHRQFTVACGLDSLTDGAGDPLSSYRQFLRPLLAARFGDPVTPGWVPADYGPIAGAFGRDYFGKANMGYAADLPWSDPVRQTSFYGFGLTHAAADPAGEWGLYASDAMVPGIQSATIASRLMVTLRSADAGFRWRSGNREGGDTATVVAAADHPRGVPIVLTRPYTAALGTEPAMQIDRVTGDLTFLAFEFATALPGARLLNLARGGQRAAEWAAMDDATARAIARAVRPDLVILNGGMNDRAIAPAPAFARDLETIVDRWQEVGSTAVLIARPNDPVDLAATHLRDYAAVIAAIAGSRRCGAIDDRAALGDYAAASAAGLMFDGVHPNAAGNRLRAAAYMARIEDYAAHRG